MNPTSRFFFELAGFALLLTTAWLAGWTAGELAWGLWVSTFAVMAVWLVVMAALRMAQKRANLLKIGGVVLGFGLTGWAVVWIYGFYGDLLDLGFPLIPDPDRVYEGGTTWRNVRPFEFWPTLVAATRQFYVVIAVSLLPLVSGLRRCWPDPDKFSRNPGLSGAAFARLHLCVMALVALQIFFREASDHYAFVFSSAILTINYFPWSQIGPASRAARSEAGAVGRHPAG